jgi:DNA adenine methylase
MNSPLSRIGGKRLLVKAILPLIPNHIGYIEPFAGASWVLFAKEPSRVEIINDYDTQLINFYRIMQKHCDELVRCISNQLVSRDGFMYYLSNPKELTDVERAAAYYYLIRNSFGSKAESYAPTQGRHNYRRELIKESLTKAAERLKDTYIENKSYEYVISRYDRVDNFFYIDPPYYGTEDYYANGNYGRQDHEKLYEQLKTIKGKFLLSMCDVPLYRELYKDYNIKEVTTKYSLSQTTNTKKAGELLIANY